MQLTKQTDYAFRTLLYLAQAPKSELQQMQQICAFYDISQNHISKIVVKLVKCGWVESVRGKGGGLRLAVKPESINLADVVRTFETVLEPVNCKDPECRIVSACTLRGVLNDALNVFVDYLAQYSLADVLVTNKGKGTFELIKMV